jgi:cell division topological specificity factor
LYSLEGVVNFFNDLFRGSRRDTSAKVAKERLLTVLVHDRVRLSPELLDQLKMELSAVIERYVPSVDPNEIEVTLLRGESHEQGDRLKADIPLRRAPE